MNEYKMEAIIEREEAEVWAQKCYEEYAEICTEEEEEWEEEDEEEDDYWEDDLEDMYDGYFYEDPMEKAMWEVGMSWHDFI